MEFVKCEQCGKIFKREAEEITCPACRNESVEPSSDRELLRMLRNRIRDAMALGEMLTLTQIVEQTGVPEQKIWHFITTGDIDMASVQDPEVQRFIQKQRLERARKLSLEGVPRETDTPIEEKPRGFHMKDEDERRR